MTDLKTRIVELAPDFPADLATSLAECFTHLDRYIADFLVNALTSDGLDEKMDGSTAVLKATWDDQIDEASIDALVDEFLIERREGNAAELIRQLCQIAKELDQPTNHLHQAS